MSKVKLEATTTRNEMPDQHIKLIVTGDLEKRSLHKSLQKAFPKHNCNGDLVIWDPPRKAIYGGFTSSRIDSSASPSISAVRLVDEMFVEALNSKRPNGVTPDLIIVIDDVELGNVGQEEVVANAFCAAIASKLKLLQAEHSANYFAVICQKIKTSCSFHLLNPMIEAYFFADIRMLIDKFCLSVPPVLLHATDVEKFDARNDVNVDWTDFCSREDRKKSKVCNWWKTGLHPKHYLSHLIAASELPPYHEVATGARMIEGTTWESISKMPTDSPSISALLEDIWDWFGVPPSPGEFLGTASPATYRVRVKNPKNMLLRNL